MKPALLRAWVADKAHGYRVAKIGPAKIVFAGFAGPARLWVQEARGERIRAKQGCLGICHRVTSSIQLFAQAEHWLQGQAQR